MDSLSKNKLSQLAQYRQQKRCDEERVFTIEGPKLCLEALRSNLTVRVVCATADFWRQQTESAVADPAILSLFNNISQETAVYEVNPQQLERLSNQRTPNKVWMLAERPDTEVNKSTMGDIVIVLDGLQDPGNLGTILRTADWFGIRQVVCSPDTVSCYNPKVVQASMGAILRTQVTYTELTPFLRDAAARGVTIYGAMLDGQNIYKTEPSFPSIIVVGNEGNGISESVAQLIERRITIPNIGGSAESLNAAIATSILCYAFCKNSC